MTIDTTTNKISLHSEKTWFIADPHFRHDAIRKFSNRPFDTVEEMDRVMMDNLHKVVPSDGTLVVLGDVTFMRDNDDLVGDLPGKHKILIKGNHDKGAVITSKKWTRICDYLEVTMLTQAERNRNLVAFHYPMVSWNGARTSIHIHGHTHGVVPVVATELGGRADVGVDVWDFAPVTFKQIVDRIDQHREQEGFLLPGRDY
jgi:calcineurin-like phosphoesterase family protein